MILSVLGTEFFKFRDPENFGTMFRTVYSLWLAIAFGSWDNNLPVQREDKTVDFGVLLYIIVVVIVLLWVALQVRRANVPWVCIYMYIYIDTHTYIRVYL